MRKLGAKKMLYRQYDKISDKSYRVAIKYFKKAIELDNRDIVYYINLSICYMGIKDYRTARDILEKAKSIIPNNLLVAENLAICEEKLATAENFDINKK